MLKWEIALGIPVEPLIMNTDVAVFEKVNTADDKVTSIHLIIVVLLFVYFGS